MTSRTELGIEPAEPAAVFAISHSLWQTCMQQAANCPKLNLSDAYAGMDGLMREVMRIAAQFETWACHHIAFDEMDEVWPYLLQDKFGECCLAITMPDALTEFDESDCLRVALQMRLPIRLCESLPVPLDLLANNPVSDSGFVAFRIQTTRWSHEDESMSPFASGEDPFDAGFDQPVFGVYGVNRDGRMEHIADRVSYAMALDLAQKIAPGIAFPTAPAFTAPAPHRPH